MAVEAAGAGKGGCNRDHWEGKSEKMGRRQIGEKERITRDSGTRFLGAANCERESFLVVREEFSLRGRKERKK